MKNLVLSIFMLFPFVLFSQNDSTIYTLQNITVTTEKYDYSFDKKLTKEHIENTSGIQDALNSYSQIDVIQRGIRGIQADISIRGNSFDQSSIFLNGANITNPQTGHYSFNIPINISDIQYMEIISGINSKSNSGANSLFGGINVVTKLDTIETANIKIGAGMYGLFFTEGKASFKVKKSYHNISMGSNKSDGYIKNSDFSVYNTFWQSHFKVNNSSIDFQFGYNDKKFGANTFYSPAYDNQYEKNSAYFASLRAETGNKFKIIPLIYWNRHNDEFQLFKEKSSNIPSWYKGHNYHKSDVLGFDLNTHYKSDIGITSIAATIRYEGIMSNVLGTEMKKPNGKYIKSDDRTNFNYRLGQEFKLFKHLNTSGDLLINYNSSIKESKIYPQIKIEYLKNGLEIYASWYKASRLPSFTELYYESATNIGNSNLSTEKTNSFEISTNYNDSSLYKFHTAFFYNENKDIIDWIKDKPEDLWRSVNLTKIDKLGFEVSLLLIIDNILKLKNNTTLNLSYTYLDQKKKSANFISNYALNYLKSKFTAQLNHNLSENLYFQIDFRFQKRMGKYLKYNNLKPVKISPYSSFSIMNISANWKIKNININVAVNNIYNTKYYDIGNITQPGFWISTGINYKLY